MKTELHGSIADVQACEERLVNCWPSHRSELVGNWLCRFAAGYSGRANSACLMAPAETLDASTILHVERLYAAAGLPPSWRLSPLAGDAIRAALESRGYRPEDPSVGMVGAVATDAPSKALRLDDSPLPAWTDGACRWQEGPKRDVAALGGIVGNIRVPARFATLIHEGQPAAYGMVAFDRGMAEIGSVMVDPARRGLGLGRQLVLGMMAWAGAAGASRMFLQASTGNGVARGLYGSLGFTDAYSAAYWRKPM